jgi:hypothetical protein
MYLAVLVGITVFMSTWIFTFYYDIFTFATSDICSSLPPNITSTPAIILAIVLVVSALFPIILFASTVANK